MIVAVAVPRHLFTDTVIRFVLFAVNRTVQPTVETCPVPLSVKPVAWIGSTRADLASFPEDVKDAIGYALYIAQRGEKHPDAKPLRGFGGAGILEIVEDHAGRYLSRRVHSPLGRSYIRFTCVSEEIKARNQDAESGE